MGMYLTPTIDTTRLSPAGVDGSRQGSKSDPNMAIDPRLWMLVSPALPIGGYSYSQGLEHAVEAGWVGSAQDAQDWITDLAQTVLPHIDLPYLCRLYRSLAAGNSVSFARWNAQLLACRETSELRAEDIGMGEALTRLLRDLDQLPEDFELPSTLTLAAAFVLACRAIDATLETTCTAYAWVWCDNQVAAAVKLVPLGHTQGQKILLALANKTDGMSARALNCPDNELGYSAPGLAIVSAAHESQYSKVFRS